MIELTENLRDDASAASGRGASPAPRILLIEDDPDLAAAVSRILTGAGYRVLAVEDGLEATFHLDKGAPDLIVSDIDLPGFNGLELLQRVRSTPALASIPLIFLTALVGGSHRRDAMDLGADDFLNKPIEREHLLRAVEGRLRRSRDYRNQCDARLRRQKDFVSLVAHDLRAPITALQLGIDLAVLRAGDCEPSTLRAMENAVGAMDRMIDRLLLMARHHGESIPFHPQWVELAEVCDNAAELSRAYCTPRHTLEVRVPAIPEGRVCLDPVLVGQIVRNLLTNAFKYSPHGGAVSLAARVENGAACFEVADNGSGMTEDEVERLFVSAFRSARHRNVHGNGLGLFGTKILVDRHGGTIECHSEIGVGSRFLVRFPLAQPDSAGRA